MLRMSQTVTALSVALLLGAQGCKKSGDNAATDAGSSGTVAQSSTPAPAPAPATPVRDEDMVGRWTVTSVVVPEGFGASWEKDLNSGVLILRPDKTYHSFNNAAGGMNGTWSASGGTLTLSFDPNTDQNYGVKSTTMEISGKQVVSGKTPGAVMRYERQADAEVKPDFTFTPTAYLDARKKAGNDADKTYKDKTIQLEGVVADVDLIGENPMFVTINPDQLSAENPTGVICYTQDFFPFARLSPGQKVTVRGTASESFLGVALRETEVVNAGPFAPTVVSAEQLATEYAKDPKATDTKYTRVGSTGKTITVTGEFLGLRNDADGKPTGIFIGKGDKKVNAFYLDHTYADDRYKKLKPGQPMQIVGKYSTYHNKDENYPTIKQCRIIPVR